MGSLMEEEDDQFFDAQEDISFGISVHSDRFRGAEACSFQYLSDECASTALSYSVWMQSPCSVGERRHKFLTWLGTSSDLVECESSADVGLDRLKDVNRIKEYSGAVLRNSGLGDDGIFFSGSSESCVTSDNSDWSRELAVKEETFVCRVGNLDGARVCLVNDLDAKMNDGQDAGSDWLDRVKESQSSTGSSPLSGHFEEGESTGANSKLEDAKKNRKGWLTKLRSFTCMVNREGGRPNECDGTDGPRAQRVKVRHNRKQVKELSALFMGQDFQAHNGVILKMKFSPDGQFLASAGEDGIVKIWQVVEHERSDHLDIPEMDPSCIYFTVNHLSELDPVSVEKEKMGKPRSLQKTPDSACVIFPPKVFRILEKPLHEFHGHGNEILDISWSNDNRLLSSSVDNTVRLWRVGSDHCLGVFKHTSYVTCVQFNPVDGNHFVSGSIDGKVRIWSIFNCQVVDWTDAREIVTAVSYRPDGQGIIVGCMSGSCRLYVVSDNHLQLEADICLCNKKKSPCKRVTGFEFFPHDSSKVMVTSADSQIRILDGINVINRYRGCRGAGNQTFAAFTSDGKHIVSASDDSSVYIWNCIDQEGPAPSEPKVIRSCERFSSNASVAVPWCGFNYGNSQNGMVSGDLGRKSPGTLPPSLVSLSLGQEFILESLPKGSATWPEEKLPTLSPWASSPAMHKTQYKFLRSSFQSTANSHAWGLVIVTAGWDGRIRCFLNYGLPVPG